MWAKKLSLFCLWPFILTVATANEPLMVVNSTLWDGNTKIFLGNCASKQPSVPNLVPTHHWGSGSVFWDLVFMAPPNKKWDKLAGYATFKKQQQKRFRCIFGVAGHGPGKKGILYQMSGETGQELQHSVLPFAIKNGALTLSDVFWGDKWRTFLAVTINDESDTGAALLIYDVTEPTQKLEHSLIFTKNELPIQVSKPIFVRFPDGSFGVSVGGRHNHKGVLQILSLGMQFLPKQILAGENALTSLLAVDLYGVGVADRIYAEDTLQWWVFDLTNFNQVTGKKLSKSISISSRAIAIQNSKMGLNLYFLGKTATETGLFVQTDRLIATDEPSSAQLVTQGDYKVIIARYGRLVLMPAVSQDRIKVINLPNHVPVTHQFKPHLVSNNPAAIVLGLALWDPALQQEVFINLNKSCQLNITTAKFNQDKYNTLAWRKVDCLEE